VLLAPSRPSPHLLVGGECGMAISDSIRGCAHCGGPLRHTKPSEPAAKFCSRTCANRWRRGRAEQPIEDRFWSKVDKHGGGECWIWKAAVSAGTGYGSFSLGAVADARCGAHRFAYEITFGPVPQGLMVCHRCDNRKCVNPAHLFVGTAKDNSDDMFQKGRARRLHGESSPGHKLTEIAVREIRASCATHQEIAKKFGISAPLVSRIKRRLCWASLQ